MRYLDVEASGFGDLSTINIFHACFGDVMGYTEEFRSVSNLDKKKFYKLIDKLFGKHEVILKFLNNGSDDVYIVFKDVKILMKFGLGESSISFEKFVKRETDEVYGIVFYYYHYDEEAAKLIDKFYKEAKKIVTKDVEDDEDSYVWLIHETNGKLDKKSFSIPTSTYKEDIIKSNYNDDFGKAYDKMIEFLKSKESGLVMLSGLPGTGKSSLIMHLVYLSEVLQKDIVIVPSSFVDTLGSPFFLDFSVRALSDSILVIEDAENVLLSRDTSKNASVSNVLNLTDGILAQVINVKVIATVNIDTDLDHALFRKGRLKAEYYFDKLTTEKCNALLKKLGIDAKVSEPHTLAEIYNFAEQVDFGGKTVGKKPMGFTVS